MVVGQIIICPRSNRRRVILLIKLSIWIFLVCFGILRIALFHVKSHCAKRPLHCLHSLYKCILVRVENLLRAPARVSLSHIKRARRLRPHVNLSGPCVPGEYISKREEKGGNRVTMGRRARALILALGALIQCCLLLLGHRSIQALFNVLFARACCVSTQWSTTLCVVKKKFLSC